MNINKDKTPYQLFCEKMGFLKVEQTLQMKQGHDIEEEARNWFHKEYGVKVHPAVATHDLHDWALASFDGINLDKEVIVEIKHVKQEFHEMALSGKVPELYYPQCQFQMYVSGWEHVHYLSYKRDKPAVVVIARDNDYISSMVEAASKFHDLLLEQLPPPLQNRDYIDVSESYELNELAQRYKYHFAAEKEHRSKAEAIKEEMKVLTNDKNVKGFGWKLTKYHVDGRLDYDAIMKNHNIDVKNCQEFKKPKITAYRITVE
jgi:putative phage-type endonuclease